MSNMNKDIYSILNSTRNNEEKCEELSDMEVDRIMKRFNESKTRKNKRINIKRIAASSMAVAACISLFAAIPLIADNKDDVNITDNSKYAPYGADVADSVHQESTSEKNSFLISASAEEASEGQTISYIRGDIGSIPFSGSYFFVHGENIKNVTISIDKGELYKADSRYVNITGKEPLKPEEEYCEYIGNVYTEEYDQNICYGLYFDEDIFNAHEKANTDNIKQAFYDCYDDLNGAELSVSVEYEDGLTDSASYILKSGMLEVDTETMKPNGNFSDGSTPYIYGVYYELKK